MKKTIKKLTAALMTVLMMAALLVTPASAVSTKADSKEALYPITDPLIDFTFKAVDLFTEALNAAAGMSEGWSSDDGKCYSDIAYGERGRQVYDLYVPKGSRRKRPRASSCSSMAVPGRRAPRAIWLRPHAPLPRRVTSLPP
ncbi:MAG: hypothetical protein IJF51_01230 [Clostridia bacterium]|nr:hypothetical protein [Clostridia bacterium]